MMDGRLARGASAEHSALGGVDAFLDAIEADGIELHSFMLHQGGELQAEAYWNPYAAQRPHMQHSATKSWTATAVGFALAEDRLSLADRVIDFFPDHLPETVSDHLAAMTVQDLLTMRTGHRTGVSGGEWRTMRSSWIEAFLREPVEDRPGKEFIYSSGSSYMLSAIVTKRTGETVRDYLEPRLFRQLGMESIRWDLSPEGICTGGNGLSCTTADVLKFGLVHLREGMWEGRQVLPAGWVREATRNHVAEVWMGAQDSRRFMPRDAADGDAVEVREGYGYQWWMTPHGGYRASGNFGQHCIVLPEQDAVIAMTAGVRLRDRRLLQAVWTHLYPALGTAAGRPADAMASHLRDLALTVPEGKAHEELEAAVGGRFYRFAANEDGATEASFDFSGDRCFFTYRDQRGEHRVEAGLGSFREGETTITGSALHHEYQPERMHVSARGVWLDRNRFVMTWCFDETAFVDTVLCTFEGEHLTLERSVNTNAGPLERPTLFGRAW